MTAVDRSQAVTCLAIHSPEGLAVGGQASQGHEDVIPSSGPPDIDSLLMDPAQQLDRRQLIDLVRKAGIPISSKPLNKSTRTAVSEPSSPRKALERLHSAPVEKIGSSSSCSSTTLTSDDGSGESDVSLSTSPHNYDNNFKQSDVNEIDSNEFRQRSGSQFYHESFRPAPNLSSMKPLTYIPSSQSAHQLNIAYNNKKKKGLLTRLRNSFRGSSNSSKHKPVGRTSSSDVKRWIDHEDDLDAVSRPSYFRHIGHIVETGPGLIQTVELSRPSQGKFGVYIAQGIDPKVPDRSSIFVSRFYQENMNMFYATLLRPGDEILAINGQLIRDMPISKVTEILEGCHTTVRLTIFPSIGL